MLNTRLVLFRVVLLLALAAAVSPVLATPSETLAENQLCERIELIFETGQLVVGGNAISAIHLIPEFYDRRNYSLAWRSESNMNELMSMIEASWEDGLTPADYHQESLGRMLDDYRAGKMTPCNRADMDILLTDALIRLGYHYIYGKVNPGSLDSDWNLAREISGKDPVEVLQEAIDADSLALYVGGLGPDIPMYGKLREALAEYRQIEAGGGWPAVPMGPALKPGMRDERIATIRARLRVTGDIADTVSHDPTLYDEDLEQAISRFQKRHALDVDGVVGKSTLAAMNIPAAERIDQIRVNLERIRWISHNLPNRLLVTDIAGFRAEILEGDLVAWESAVQVGKPYRKTPVFRDTLKYIVFNPTWTVPPTIFAKDILPKIKQDPEFLKKKNMRVIDRDGNNVDAGTIDWSATTRRNFPFMIRQDPGPDNALGRVKFMFPNKHAVYLHDTPHQSGFGRAARAFSSGCIRVQKPFELAEILLNDPENWSLEKIRQVIDSKKTTTVHLQEPIPVYLLYWTVAINEEMLYFKPDVYSRDGKVLAALNGSFRLEVPEKMPEWFKN